VKNEYRSIGRWRVKASAEEVFEILRRQTEYPRWWPAVCLAARETRPGRVHIRARSWFPLALSWDAHETLAHEPNLFSIEVRGDLTGRGVWSIVPDGEFVDISFDWIVTLSQPLLRRLSFVLKPAFEAGHKWAMEQGLRSLELELERGRAGSVGEMNRIPAPPEPNRILRPELIAEAALAAAVLIGLSGGAVKTQPGT
jgi:hypothetical protein